VIGLWQSFRAFVNKSWKVRPPLTSLTCTRTAGIVTTTLTMPRPTLNSRSLRVTRATIQSTSFHRCRPALPKGSLKSTTTWKNGAGFTTHSFMCVIMRTDFLNNLILTRSGTLKRRWLTLLTKSRCSWEITTHRRLPLTKLTHSIVSRAPYPLKMWATSEFLLFKSANPSRAKAVNSTLCSTFCKSCLHSCKEAPWPWMTCLALRDRQTSMNSSSFCNLLRSTAVGI